MIPEFLHIAWVEWFSACGSVPRAIPYQRLAPTSRKIAEQTFFSSSAFSIMLVILCTWSTVECLLRNPNRWFGIRFFLSIIGFNLLISNFSNSFDITGNNEIGLYDAASCGGFPGFGIMITSDTFHSLGTYFSLKAALIK